ncbi:glycosyltransferase family 2 protein [Mariniflexile aquimaris]|uniref:Glycosyltransferase family 2 protein n=1 Tax=Mariniflexile aquimaris TaxID=881009 RepID=A0ABW3BT23_9FLAO
MNLRVTILLSTYNRAHFVLETLQSIKNQTYANWECIVIDDYSVDNTKVVINEFIKDDSRFSYFLKTEKYNKGLSGSRNQGLDIAESRNAEFIQFFDDDDIMHPRKLELQINPFLEDETLDVTFCKYRKFGDFKTINFDLESAEDNSTNILTNDLFWDFLYNNISLNSLGPIWKLSSIKNYKFDERLFTGEERDFYLRIFFKENLNFKPVDKILFWYRKHKESVTKGSFEKDKVYRKSLRLIRFKTYKMIIFSRKVNFSQRVNFLIRFLKEIVRY